MGDNNCPDGGRAWLVPFLCPAPWETKLIMEPGWEGLSCLILSQAGKKVPDEYAVEEAGQSSCFSNPV